MQLRVDTDPCLLQRFRQSRKEILAQDEMSTYYLGMC